MEGHNLPNSLTQTRKYTHTADESFPKMPTINIKTLPLPPVVLISYNQNNKHSLSHVPPMVYL